MIAVYKPEQGAHCVGCHEKAILRVDSGKRKTAVWTAHFCRECAIDYGNKLLHAVTFDYPKEDGG